MCKIYWKMKKKQQQTNKQKRKKDELVNVSFMWVEGLPGMPNKYERKRKMSCMSGSSILEGNLNWEGEQNNNNSSQSGIISWNDITYLCAVTQWGKLAYIFQELLETCEYL